jgi:hypothetical protein
MPRPRQRVCLHSLRRTNARTVGEQISQESPSFAARRLVSFRINVQNALFGSTCKSPYDKHFSWCCRSGLN